MAVTSGTVWSADTRISDSVSPLQVAEVLFTMSGTYATADGSKLVGVAALISASRRNGKTCTMRGVMLGTPGVLSSDGTNLTLKTVAISSADVTFKLCGSDYTTEIADAAIGGQSRPFALLVAFTEA